MPAWDAFWTLGGDRHLGFGHPGAIPFLALDAYARRVGVNHPDDFARFSHLVMALDRTYRAWLAEKFPLKSDE